MLRIHIITQNEPFYIPKMIQHIINSQNNSYCIVGYTVLNPARKNSSKLSWIIERTKIYSYGELIMVAFLYLYVKLYSIFTKHLSPYSCRSLFKAANIPEIQSSDINSEEYVNELNHHSLDIIVSISCPQIFKSNILNVPKIACINAHGTLLPRHRGVFGSFWTLFDGDKVAGATLHTMEERLDAGQIVWQSEFSLVKEDTQYSIAYKTKRAMAKGLVELFNKYVVGTVETIVPSYPTSYHRAPSREEGKEFHKKGLRIICMKDVEHILTKSFHL